jgi:MFS family permease
VTLFQVDCKGNIGVVKTYLGEITDSTNQTRAFGYIGFSSGLGSIVGGMLGGLIARPAGGIFLEFS